MKRNGFAKRLLTLLLVLVVLAAVNWLMRQMNAAPAAPPQSSTVQLSSLPAAPSEPAAEPVSPAAAPNSAEAPPESPSAAPESSEIIGAEPSSAPAAEPSSAPSAAPEDEAPIAEDGAYTTKEDVALYLATYGHLPENFITKNEARRLGWNGGSLERYAPGCCIGGDRFSNREDRLPKAKGRTYIECDIDTMGKKSRGAKRIVFSNDGLIYYTDDHYESFTLLYGEE